ncbi:4'-phosphopantetheinyl transferase family protein [Marinomonas alcarazii]|nr:4'-phosphopantetheinyl transferase superfamily protein [Marinomonas alcarazii]
MIFILSFYMDVKVNCYSQTQILLFGTHVLHVSHLIFKEESLVATDYEASIAKPSGYSNWRAKRKASFLAGRLAVRHRQSCLNLPLTDIPKAKDGSPVWPEDYIGSISHTEKQAVAVILPRSKQAIQHIGIDLELLDHADKFDAANLIGLASEFEILEAMGVEKKRSTLLLFSLKESVYKALFPLVGEFFDFLDVALVATDDEAFEFRVRRQLSFVVGSGFTLHARYKIQDDHIMTWAYC